MNFKVKVKEKVTQEGVLVEVAGTYILCTQELKSGDTKDIEMEFKVDIDESIKKEGMLIKLEGNQYLLKKNHAEYVKSVAEEEKEIAKWIVELDFCDLCEEETPYSTKEVENWEVCKSCLSEQKDYCCSCAKKIEGNRVIMEGKEFCSRKCATNN